MNPLKTPKGTELQLIDLRGKAYMAVQQRLIWFREEKPLWCIETKPVEMTENHAIFCAMIKDEHCRLVSQAHKKEDRKGFPDFIEKAETGSIGRALANLGYGTAHAVEILESDVTPKGADVVDAPVEKPKPKWSPSPEQLTRLFTIANASGYTKPAASELLQARYGLTSSKELTKYQYDDLCKYMQAYPVTKQDSGESDSELT